MSPYALLLERLGDRVTVRRGLHAEARCPGHDDRKASLTIDEKNGVLVLCCHAGCPNAELLRPLGLSLRDLYPEPTSGSNGGDLWTPRGPAVAVYSYIDEAGVVLFDVCRTADKQFPQRRPDPHSRTGYGWRLGDVRRVLYRLPDVLAAVQAGKTIFLAEGEKDVQALERAGVTATCNPGGASKNPARPKWRPEYTETLRGAAAVIIIADKDEAGGAHALAVYRALQGAVRAVEIRQALVGKDAADHLAAGCTLDMFLPVDPASLNGGDPTARVMTTKSAPVAAETPRAPDAAPPPAGLDQDDPSPLVHAACTDAGNAARLAAYYRGRLIYVPAVGWHWWTGSHWERDVEEIHATRAAQETIRATGHAALDLVKEDRRRDPLIKWTRDSESDYRLTAMRRLARSHPDFTVPLARLDHRLGLLACPNGTVELCTGALRPAQPEDYITRCAAVPYDPRARCPRFLRFLRQVQPAARTRAWLQKAIGYSATGTTREETIFFPNGGGANGKSKFLDAVSYALGTYAATTPATTFQQQTNDTIPNDLAALVGVRLVSAFEVGDVRPLACGRIKQLTGRDPIPARFLHREWFAFLGQFAPWFVSNARPTVDDTSEGFWRRMRVILFAVTIAEADQDQLLADKLHAEAPGILRWIVQGARRWYGRTGDSTLGWCPEVRAATEAYRSESDQLGEYLTDATDPSDPAAHTPVAALYASYTRWAQANGVPLISKRKLGTMLTLRGYADAKVDHVRCRRGLRLLAQPDEDDDALPF